MSRIGYDKRKHPYELQLRIGAGLDYQGLENKSCLSLNLQEGKITEYHTDEDMIKTEIREYIASDEELEELYSFLTMEAIEEFESMLGTKNEQYATGYYDCAVLKYFLIGPDGKIADGSRGGIYSNDPINMTCEWVRRIFPYLQHTI